MDRVKKPFGPSLWLQWFQDNRLAILAHTDCRSGKVKTLGQTNGLTLTFINDSGGFHNDFSSMLL